MAVYRSTESVAPDLLASALKPVLNEIVWKFSRNEREYAVSARPEDRRRMFFSRIQVAELLEASENPELDYLATEMGVPAESALLFLEWIVPVMDTFAWELVGFELPTQAELKEATEELFPDEEDQALRGWILRVAHLRDPRSEEEKTTAVIPPVVATTNATPSLMAAKSSNEGSTLLCKSSPSEDKHRAPKPSQPLAENQELDVARNRYAELLGSVLYQIHTGNRPKTSDRQSSLPAIVVTAAAIDESIPRMHPGHQGAARAIRRRMTSQIMLLPPSLPPLLVVELLPSERSAGARADAKEAPA